MQSIKSQEKRLKQEERTEKPDSEESISFFFEKVNVPKNKNILNLKISELKNGDNLLAKNIELKIDGPKHICIIGKNGMGKTTLIKMIYETLKIRPDLKVGYMPQNYDDIWDEQESAVGFLTSRNKIETTTARKYLGNLNFTRAEMTDPIQNLSKGTQAKLILIKLVLEKCNVLLLDEPTRNVSPLSNPVIRRVLRDFNGTIISVSHDRKYIEEVIDEIFELTPSGLQKMNEKGI